jgi:hypothetical protein
VRFNNNPVLCLIGVVLQMSSTARIVLFLGVASFVAFSIGLNMGLLGFFHREIVTSQPLNHPNSMTDSRLHRNPIFHDPDKTISFRESDTPIVVGKPTIEVPVTLPPAVVSVTNPPVTTKPPVIMHETAGGPISQFLAKGGQIPIILLTCNRLELLEQTIQSLLKVSDVSKDIIIIQDGEVPGVVVIAQKYNLQLVQNKAKSNLRNVDGAARIAMHYKFSLSTAFDMRPDAPAVIITEDDLLFSPDFYQYFVHTAPLLEQDPSTLLISAWNDNGFKGRVQDPFELRRTDYFPGLGWLLTR